MTMAMEATGAPGAYPVRYDVSYPETLSRWLPLVKWLLAIPHLIIVYFLGQVFQLLGFVALIIILFTAKYPEGIFKFNVGIQRWTANAYAYVALMRDEYPPFSFDAGQYPVVYEVDYASPSNRFAPLYQWILAIPHYIILIFLLIAAIVVTIIAFFAILFTTKYPQGMFDFVVGVGRWSNRVNAYAWFLTSEYPPFSMKAEPGP